MASLPIMRKCGCMKCFFKNNPHHPLYECSIKQLSKKPNFSHTISTYYYSLYTNLYYQNMECKPIARNVKAFSFEKYVVCRFFLVSHCTQVSILLTIKFKSSYFSKRHLNFSARKNSWVLAFPASWITASTNACMENILSIGLSTFFVSLEKNSVLDHLEQYLRLRGSVSTQRLCYKTFSYFAFSNIFL